MNNVYKRVKEFKSKYPATVAWRLKANSKVVEKHINPDEKVLYEEAIKINGVYAIHITPLK